MNWYKRIITADKKDYLINKMKIDPEIVNWAEGLSLQIDPKKSYMQWLAVQAQKNIVIPGEDNDKLIGKLTLYDKLKKLKEENKKIDRLDINSFKTYGELAKYLEPFASENTESKRGKEKRLAVEGAVPIMANGDVEIFRIDTEQAAAKICRDTEWCIKDPKYFNEYKPPYYVFFVNGKRYSLLHINSGQFKNEYDDSMNLKTIALIINILPEFIDKIIGGKNINNLRGDLKVIEESLKYRNNLVKDMQNGNIDNALNSIKFDLSFYEYIPQEYRTEEIQNEVVSVINKRLEGTIRFTEKNSDNMKYIQSQVKELSDDFSKISNEIYNRIDPVIIKKSVDIITSFLEKDITTFSYIWDQIPDNLKNEIGDQGLSNIIINKLQSKELETYDKVRVLQDLSKEMRDVVPKDFLINFSNSFLLELMDENTRLENNTSYIWGELPDYIQLLISLDSKSFLANQIADEQIKKKYNTTGIYPNVPEDLLSFVPENKIIQMWSKFAYDMPEQYEIIDPEIKEKIPKKGIANSFMRLLLYHPFHVDQKIPDDIRPLIPIDFINKAKIDEFKANTYTKFSSDIVSQMEQILPEAEIGQIYINRILQVPDDYKRIYDNPSLEKYKKYITEDVLIQGFSNRLESSSTSLYLDKVPEEYLPLLSDAAKNNISNYLNGQVYRIPGSYYNLPDAFKQFVQEPVMPGDFQFENTAKSRSWYKKAQSNRKEFLEQAALKEYGETDIIDYAGYILEDGTLLDFSEGGVGGIRSIDHRNIGAIADFGIPQNSYASATRTMNKFMNETGAVRVMSHDGMLSIHSNTPLSSQQINTVKRSLRNYSSLNVDIYNGIDEESSSGDKLLNTEVDLQFSAGEGMRFLDNINEAFNPYVPKYKNEIYDQIKENLGDWDYTNEDIDSDYDSEESVNDLLGRNVFEDEY